jgi:hypothetical protein
MDTWIRYSTADHRYMPIPQMTKPHPMAPITLLHRASHCPSRTSGRPDINAKVALLPM